MFGSLRLEVGEDPEEALRTKEYKVFDRYSITENYLAKRILPEAI